MNRVGMVFLVGAALAVLLAPCEATLAQDFPYAVPQAPEFDTGSSMLPPESVQEAVPEPKSPLPQPSPHRTGTSGERKTDYRAVRPFVPQDPPSPQSRPKAAQIPQAPHVPQRPVAEPPRMGNPAVASTPPGPPPQMEQRLDCSKFPIMIAQAKSEQEMQWTARLYLTCLIRSGWNMEQAKQQVISTIESTYRLAR